MSKTRQLSDAINSVDISQSAPDDAVTLDASGNLLVGTTISPGPTSPHNSSSNEGITFQNNGFLGIGRSGNLTAIFNRQTSDGAIVNFDKDGGSIGSIGHVNDFAVYSTESGHGGFRFGSGNIMPTNNTGTDTDNLMDLGRSSTRFKDLYLSGGVYLGGTGSANHLDDYEEGTWTPVMKDTNAGGATVGTTGVTAFYTKVGRFVNATLYIQRNDASSLTGDLYVTGLPFTTANYPAVNGGAWFNNSSSDWKTFVYSGTSVTEASFPKTGNIDGYLTTNNWDDGRYIYASFSYITT